MARSVRSLLPSGARRRIRDASGISALHDRVAELEAEVRRLESALHESRDEVWERSRERWRAATPDPNLTWDVELTGDAFIGKAAEQGAFGPDRRIVEVGPGYGRLLSTALEQKREFESWTGVDLSEANVEHLGGKFSDPRVSFIQADVESAEVEGGIDTIVSSLTFKHLFPSFEKGLTNLAGQMRPGGVALFDLIEGERRYFEQDDVTYIRWYTRPEIEEILGRAGLEPAGFDEVQHHPNVSRLLVIARRP